MHTPVQIHTGKSAVLAGAAITLSVVSTDKELIALCREILRELTDALGDLELHSKTEVPHANICLWDCETAEFDSVPEDFDERRVFYVVPPSRLESLLRAEPAAEGHILLKPLTRAVLRTFLWSAAPVKENPAFSVLGSVRANRDDLLQRLLHANLRLQEYDQQRTNFIARAVHDFRAPLTALSGFCGLMASGQLGPLNDQQLAAMKRMEHSAKRLSRMASAMFELSIGARVNRTPELRPADIVERMRQALYEITPLVNEKQISVKADDIVPPDRPLWFESSQIEQVLINLLDNACKFTHRDGAIEVRGYPYFWDRRFLVRGTAPKERRVDQSRRSNSYRIDIKDTGPGIRPERLNHIFEEYTSYGGPQDRSGGGLGLAICRLIISRHEGHVWAESHEGGAVFSFVLPYRADTQGNIPGSA
jgi:signal transduction histidine kinase